MEEIFHAALPLTLPEREAFVVQSCEGDDRLQDEVSSLLSADDLLADFLEEPISGLGLAVLADQLSVETEIVPRPVLKPAKGLEGERLSGRYEVTKQLGVGGFGDVYKAIDTKIMSRPVVIKVLKEEVLASDPARRDWVIIKFKQEIEALAKIDHPGVVRILDTDSLPDGRPYIVMEFVEGTDLRHFMKAARQAAGDEFGVGFPDVAEVIRQVGRTLTAAHEAGIYHRDLKPENIMLRRNPSGDLQVKVIDFGIAKVTNSLIATSSATGLMVAGTWPYMSPEQLRGKKVDAACDTYALAVIAYELVTGRLPFAAKDAVRLKELQEAGLKIKPGDLNVDLPAAAQDAIVRALQFYPADRPRRARDFGDELAAALVTEEELVRPDPTVKVDLEGDTWEDIGHPALVDIPEPVLVPVPEPSPPAITPPVTAPPSSWFASHRRWVYVGAMLLLLAASIGVGLWLRSRDTVQPTPVVTPGPAVTGPERALAIGLHVLMPKGDGAFDEFDSTGDGVFVANSKIFMHVQPKADGYLYVVDESNGPNGTKQWYAVFPNHNFNNQNSKVQGGQDLAISNLTMDTHPGEEMLHLVWSAKPVDDLESLFGALIAANHGEAFAAPAQNALASFFQRNAPANTALTIESAPTPHVVLNGKGDLALGLLTLKHIRTGN